MSDWIEHTLSEIADIRVSNVDKKRLPGEIPIQLCNYMDAYSNDYINSNIAFMEASASSAEITKFRVDAGDVVITKDSETPDDIGIPAVIVEKIENLVCGYHLALLKPKQELVDPVFLCKQLGSQRVARYFGQRATGSTRYGLSNSVLANIRIPLPVLAKQKKIAAILTSIDTAIEKTEALIEKYQQIKAGLMHDLFTRGVLPNGQLRPPRDQAPELYQETAIGWIPKDWAVLHAGAILTRIDAGWSPECQETPPGAGEWGILKVSAVTRGVYDPSESKILPQELVPDPTIEVVNGDVILTRANGVAELVGVTVQVKNTPTKLMLSDKLLRLLPNQEKMTKDFLALLMCSSWIKTQIDSVMSGSSGQRNISQSQIKNFFCVCPCLKEQEKIVTYIRAVEVNLERENLTKEKLIRQRLGLMQDLLTGRTTVKIDVVEQGVA